MNKKIDKQGAIAIGQVIILMVAIVGFAWIIGGMQRVRADSSSGESCGGGFIRNGQEYKGNCLSAKIVFNGPTECGSLDLSYFKSAGLCKKETYCCASPVNQKKVTKTGGVVKDIKDVGKNVVTFATGRYIESTIFPVTKKVINGAVDYSNWVFIDGKFVSPTDLKTTINGELFGSSIAYTAAAIVSAAAAAYTFSKIFRMIGGNADQQNLLGSFGAAAGATATLAIAYPATFKAIGTILGTTGLVTAGIIAAAVFLIFAIFSSSTVEQGVVVYNCQPWDAATGGKDCSLCNNQEIPCSEYQCKSLGQSCSYIQSAPDQEGRSFCFFNNSRDVDPPVISPNEGVLNIGYEYTPNEAISPPDRGVKIIDSKSKDGCLSPFSKVTFGVKLNEPAKCKIDFRRKKSYDKMSLPFGKPYLNYNHTQTLVIPELNNSLGKNNQILTYVRCQDSNGNFNKNNFVFEMCVQEGPDTTPPIIYGTSIKSGSKVPFNVTRANVDFYVNEPAECRWSFSDKKYDDMANNMTCVTNATQINLRLSYTCSSNLTGIKNQEKTNYFVRCRDQPNLKNVNDRNTNAESYKYNLQSSKALVIVEASPNGTTIKGSTSPAAITLRARTLGGTYEGNALCYSSPDGVEGNYKEFENSGSTNKHSTKIYLEKGNYEYHIKCLDFGGNVDVKKINFSVDIDQEAPVVVRAYYEMGSNQGYMKIITDEKAECRYSTSTLSCEYSFDDGTKMTSYNKMDHLVKWDTNSNLYIKCQDIYGNQPKTNECSIIVRAQNGQNF